MFDLMRNIVSQLNYHQYLYYEKSSPIISDEAYDSLYKKYQDLCSQNPEILNDPEFQIGVGYNPTSQIFEKVSHSEPMLSLKKISNEDDLLFQIRKWGENEKVNLQPKIDGVSLSLIYENGILLKAVTRGNGKIGDNVTHNALNIKGIPYEIPFKERIEIRGEVYIPKSIFIEVQKKYLELKNERNAASGALRQKDPDQCKDRGLHFLAYDIKTEINYFTNYKELRDNLKTLGFSAPVSLVVLGVRAFEKLDVIKTYNEKDADYRTDGVVVRLYNTQLCKELGNNTNWPEWAFAYKFEAETAVTKLLSVEWNVGKSGALTPVGYIDPVDLAGATIKKASLCNLDELNRLGIRIGSQILIKRSNEVIPKITEVLDNKESSEISIPQSCPSCNSKLEVDGPRLICINSKTCPDQILGKIYHAVCVFEVDNLGDKQVKKLIDLGYLKTPFDILTLTADQIASMDNVKDKQTNRILDSLNKSKEKMNSERVLRACNIPNLGSRSEKLLEIFSLDQLPDLTIEQLSNIEGFGEIIAENILNWFQDKDNLNLYENFVRYLKDNKKYSTNKELLSTSLEGKTFVITGTLPTMKREEATDLIKSHGGKVLGSVSSKLDYLLAGVDAGSKLEKALKLNITVIDEDYLKALINNAK